MMPTVLVDFIRYLINKLNTLIAEMNLESLKRRQESDAEYENAADALEAQE